MNHRPSRREVFAVVIPFALGGSVATAGTVDHGPVEVDAVIRGLRVKRIYLGPGETLPTRYAGLPSATIHRPRGEREVIVSFGVTRERREWMDADDARCDLMDVDRNGWELYEGETLALIRMGG